MVQQMKQCPTCRFTFADFHRLCTFDGAELVPFENSQALMKVAPAPAARALKPSMSLTSLAVLGVFLSAVMIAYLKSPNPSIPPVVQQQHESNLPTTTTRVKSSEEAAADSTPVARASRVRGNQNRRIANSKSLFEATRGVNRAPSFATARQREVPQTSRTYPSSRTYPPNATIARQQEEPKTSRDKSPKVVSLLKTTWRVLKKPF